MSCHGPPFGLCRGTVRNDSCTRMSGTCVACVTCAGCATMTWRGGGGGGHRVCRDTRRYMGQHLIVHQCCEMQMEGNICSTNATLFLQKKVPGPSASPPRKEVPLTAHHDMAMVFLRQQPFTGPWTLNSWAKCPLSPNDDPSPAKGHPTVFRGHPQIATFNQPMLARKWPSLQSVGSHQKFVWDLGRDCHNRPTKFCPSQCKIAQNGHQGHNHHFHCNSIGVLRLCTAWPPRGARGGGGGLAGGLIGATWI